jgi:hypothetical protein
MNFVSFSRFLGLFCLSSLLCGSLSRFDSSSLSGINGIIADIEADMKKSPTIEDYVSLSILYSLKDEQYLQSSYWKSLYYTSKALQIVTDGKVRRKASLKFALKLKQASSFILLGRFGDTVHKLDKEIEELQDRYIPPFQYPVNRECHFCYSLKVKLLWRKEKMLLSLPPIPVFS